MRVGSRFVGLGSVLCVLVAGCGGAGTRRDPPGSGGAWAAGGDSSGTAATSGAGADGGLGGSPAGTGGVGGSAGDPSGGAAGSGATIGGSGGMAGGAAGFGGLPPPGGTGGRCNEPLSFELQLPTVLIVVDRSGSMFQTAAWESLRTGILDLVERGDSEIRFGFMAFTGDTGQCPILDLIPPELENYGPIEALYSSLVAPPSVAQTPTTLALREAQELLLTDTTTRDQVVLLVSDGDSDYCDDSHPFCAFDSVTYRLQQMWSAGVPTLVAGVQSQLIHPGMLQGFANAGMGLGVDEPSDTTTIYDNCNTHPGWRAEFDAAGRSAGQELATYGAGGNAPIHTPDVGGTALSSNLAAALRRTIGCTFDVVGGAIDLALAHTGQVVLDGTALVHEHADGWRMVSPTSVELTGAACDAFRGHAAPVSFLFPCSARKFD